MSEGVSEWVSARGIECLTENERVKKSVIQSVGGRMCAWADWLANWVSEWVSMRDWVLEWKSVSHSVGGWANVCVGEQASERVSDWLTDWAGGWDRSGWVSEWESNNVSQWVSDRESESEWLRVCRWMRERASECASERANLLLLVLALFVEFRVGEVRQAAPCELEGFQNPVVRPDGVLLQVVRFEFVPFGIGQDNNYTCAPSMQVEGPVGGRLTSRHKNQGRRGNTLFGGYCTKMTNSRFVFLATQYLASIISDT